MKNFKAIFSTEKGMTLVEVVVAIVILSGLIFTFTNIFVEGIRTRMEERERSRGVEELSSIMEEIIEIDREDIDECDENGDDLESKIEEDIITDNNADDNYAKIKVNGCRVTIEYFYEDEASIEMTTYISLEEEKEEVADVLITDQFNVDINVYVNGDDEIKNIDAYGIDENIEEDIEDHINLNDKLEITGDWIIEDNHKVEIEIEADEVDEVEFTDDWTFDDNSDINFDIEADESEIIFDENWTYVNSEDID
ncbi:type IV pilus modification PilV family protein, partial [Halarsenatibacter silvermanii]